MRGRLALDYPLARDAFDEEPGEDAASADDDSRDVKQRTADSFAYEWQRFGALREHVDEELFAVHVKRHLTTNEREARAELDHEALDLGDQRPLEAALSNVCGETEELEVVVPRGRSAGRARSPRQAAPERSS